MVKRKRLEQRRHAERAKPTCKPVVEVYALTDSIVQHRVCRTCNNSKPLGSDFYRIPNKTRGVLHYALDCKPCTCDKRKHIKLTAEQRERKLAKERQRRQSPEFKEYQRGYKAKNRERLRTNARLWARKKYGFKPREKWTVEKRKACVRNSILKSKYKITQVDYNRLLELQNGLCAICQQPPVGTKPMEILAVDHDHETGKVRGLLCHKHNSGLGMFGDNPELLKSALDYLLKHH